MASSLEPEFLKTSSIISSTGVVVSASTATFAVAPGGCRHLLRIDGYSKTKLLGKCAAVHVCNVNAGGHGWLVEYYPNGVSPDDAGSVCFGVTLYHHRTDRGVPAKVGFSLVPQRGDPSPAQPCSKKFAHTFHDDQKCVVLIAKVELEQSVYLVDDTFVVQCDIDVIVASGAADLAVPVRDVEMAGLLCACENEDGLCKFLHARDCVRKEQKKEEEEEEQLPSSCWSWLLDRKDTRRLINSGV